jgi:hypothetical protein
VDDEIPYRPSDQDESACAKQDGHTPVKNALSVPQKMDSGIPRPFRWIRFCHIFTVQKDPVP